MMDAPYPDVRYGKQEWYDFSRLPWVPWRDWLVYENVNVSIFLTDHCNGNCPFCVAKLRYEADGTQYVKPAIKDRDAYLRRLRVVLEMIRPLNPSISITGGEPSLSPWLPDVLAEVDRLGFRKRTITTNGTGLLDGDLMALLGRYGIEYLNISRAHFSDHKNRKLMQFEDDGLDEVGLRRVVEQARQLGIRSRLSCVLAQSGVFSFPLIEDYLTWASDLGVDNVVFRQLMQFGVETEGSVVEFSADQFVDLTALLEQFDGDERFAFKRFLLGYYYYVEVFRFNRIDVVAEMADLSLIAAQRKRGREVMGMPIIFEMVIHPNGSLCGSWREWEEVLDEDVD